MMIKNNLKKKIISAVVLGSVVTSLGITAFASDLNKVQTRGEKGLQKESRMKNNAKENIKGNNKEKTCEKDNRNGQQRMTECLKKSGIFTDSKIAEIKTYLESKRDEIDKERESLKDKTEEERKAYFEANKDKRQDMMSALVTDGIITQEQLDKLKETMPKERQFKNR